MLWERYVIPGILPEEVPLRSSTQPKPSACSGGADGLLFFLQSSGQNLHACPVLPTVDILMPVRNAAATLAEALDSVAAQAGVDWRLIAVDDHSTDDSRSLLAGFRDRFPRTVIVGSEGRGLVAALTTGLKLASAPVIARMDADDLMTPNRLARQTAWLAGHPEVGVVACRAAYEGRGRGFARYVQWSNRLQTHDEIFRDRFIESPVIHPTVCFRREVVARHGGYAEGDFPEDYELWLRWLAAGVRFAKLPDVLLTWRDHPDRLTRTEARYRAEAFYRIKCRYLADWLRPRLGDTGGVWLWGAGYATRRRFRNLWEEGIPLRGWIDIDPAKIGRRFRGTRVIAPESLAPATGDVVIAGVGSRGAREIISAWLEARGFRAGEHYICAA